MSAAGDIRCLSCGHQYAEAPAGWDCTECGGPVSQHAGTVVVGGSASERLVCVLCRHRWTYRGEARESFVCPGCGAGYQEQLRAWSRMAPRLMVVP